MIKREKELALDEIDLKDQRFRISLFFSIKNLLSSVKKVGLIYPPLLTIREGRIVLVSGWKRVEACRLLGISSIPGYFISDNDDLKVFHLAFFENLATRDFNVLEKAEILKKLISFGEKEKRIISEYLPLLGLPPTSTYLNLYLAFSEFEIEEKELIHQNEIPFSSLEILAKLKREERELIFPLLLPLGKNKQKELLECALDLAGKKGISIKSIFHQQEIREILESRNISALEKSQKIRLLLRREKYPLLSSWSESLKLILKKTRWPKDIILRPSPFFEEEKMSIFFDFKNEQEFVEKVSKLVELTSKKEFKGIWRPFFDEGKK